MPNLRQIYELKKQYSELSPQDRIVNEYIEKSQTKDTIEKAFGGEILNEHTRAFAFLKENLNVRTPDLITYFEEGREEYVALFSLILLPFQELYRVGQTVE